MATTLWSSVLTIFSFSKRTQMECFLQYLLAFVPAAAYTGVYDVFLHHTFSFQHHAISLMRTRQKGQLSLCDFLRVTRLVPGKAGWKCWAADISIFETSGAMCPLVGRRWMVFSPLKARGLPRIDAYVHKRNVDQWWTGHCNTDCGLISQPLSTLVCFWV